MERKSTFLKTFLIIFITVLLMLCSFMAFYIYLDAKEIVSINLPAPVDCAPPAAPPVLPLTDNTEVQNVLEKNFNDNSILPKSFTTKRMEF